MRLSLLLAAMPIAIYAQDAVAERITEGYPNTFSSGASYVEKFDNKARKLNDWAISIGSGAAFMQSADLVSIRKDGVNTGWNAYVSLDKQITHTFGLILQYQMGETKQMGTILGRGTATGTTKFNQINLLGDINFSNLLRRTDNKSPYRWAIHGYVGIGLQGYKTKLTEQTLPGVNQSWFVKAGGEIEQELNVASFFYQGGAGVKYKLSKRVDVEARAMYIISGDDEFDGAGWESDVAGKDGVMSNRTIDYPYNYIKKNSSDNFFTVNLGLSFKLGKHNTHLAWYDPLQNAYSRVNTLKPITNLDLQVCEKGDNDNDGVCDDWDRQLNTPSGARVDGSGVALDIDLDEVIDLHDKCVTVPGPIDNQGCPTVEKTPMVDVTKVVESVNRHFEGIEFALNKDVIRPISFDKLNQAAEVIKSLGSAEKFLVIGATDTRGSQSYNLSLSQKRANAVVQYLVNKGVNPNILIAEGRGQNDLKYPECDPATKCPEWKNEANRRVYFQKK